MEKSLQIQSSYYSALILSFNCTPLSNNCPLPVPPSMSQKDTSNCLLASECHMMSVKEGRHCSWWHLQVALAFKLGLGGLRQA